MLLSLCLLLGLGRVGRSVLVLRHLDLDERPGAGVVEVRARARRDLVHWCAEVAVLAP